MNVKIVNMSDINEVKRKFKEDGFNFSKLIEDAIEKNQLIYIESNNNHGWLSILDWKNIDGNNIGMIQNYNTDSFENIDEIIIKLIEENLHNYKEIYNFKVLNNNLNIYLDSGFEHVDTLVLYENTDMNYNIIESRFNIIESEISQLDDMLRVDNSAFDGIWKESRDVFKNTMQMLSSINNRSIVVKDEDKIIGYAIYKYIENDKKGYISRLAVDPMYQNRKIGKQILNDCIKWLKDKGALKVELTTQTSNSRSRPLYEGLDFKSVRELAVVKITNDLLI
jgi:ribosomal protein S18 acetylase RimI-like enzyme